MTSREAAIAALEQIEDTAKSLEAENERLREALRRIDRGWAAPPAGTDHYHWTQVIAQEALAQVREPE